MQGSTSPGPRRGLSSRSAGSRASLSRCATRRTRNWLRTTRGCTGRCPTRSPSGSRAAFDAGVRRTARPDRCAHRRLVGGVVSDRFHPTDAQLAVQAETGTGQLRLDLSRRLVAEALGTALLIIAVIGSGIMASRLSPSDVGLQLLENAAATAGALIGLILMFGAVSGAHFNPVVTLVDRLLGTITTRDAALYAVAQTVGGAIGAVIANLMFSLPAVQLVDACPVVGCAVAVGGRSDDRSAAGDPRLRAHRSQRGGAVRRRCLDRWRLLVHVVDQLRQSRRHRSPGCSPTASPASNRRRHRCSSSCNSSAHSSPTG